MVTYREELVDVLDLNLDVVGVDVFEEHQEEIIRNIIVGGHTLFSLGEIVGELGLKVR